MAKVTPKLGRVQLQIMQILWERGEATAREITAALNLAEPVAHSTTQTLLRKLEAKGAAAHTVRDRVFVFRPLSREADTREFTARDLLTRVFGGSVSTLVSHLLKHEAVSGDELKRLRELIDAAAAGETGKEDAQ